MREHSTRLDFSEIVFADGVFDYDDDDNVLNNNNSCAGHQRCSRLLTVIDEHAGYWLLPRRRFDQLEALILMDFPWGGDQVTYRLRATTAVWKHETIPNCG